MNGASTLAEVNMSVSNRDKEHALSDLDVTRPWSHFLEQIVIYLCVELLLVLFQ